MNDVVKNSTNTEFSDKNFCIVETKVTRTVRARFKGFGVFKRAAGKPFQKEKKGKRTLLKVLLQKYSLCDVY